MSQNNKKLVIIGIILIAVLIIIGIVVFIRQRQQAALEDKTQNTKISADKILFPTFSPDNKILFFANTSVSAFYEMDSNGKNISQISDSFDTPDDVIWAPDKKSAILRVIYDQYVFEKYGSQFASPGTPDQTETTWLYNLESKNLVKLDDHLAAVVWTADNKIIYQYLDVNNNISNISLANADGSNSTKIVDLPSSKDYNFNLTPDGRNLIIFSVPSDVSKSTLYTLSLAQKELKQIKEFPDPIEAVAISNDKIIYTTSITDSNARDISIMNLNGGNNKNLNLQAIHFNWASFGQNKIVFTSTKDRQNNSVINSFDLGTSKITEIKDLSKDKFNIQTFLNSPDSKTLYFTSDDYLYRLTLP